MTPRTPPSPTERPRTLVPSTPLIAGGFGASIPAERALTALARGLAAGGRPHADLCPLPVADVEQGSLREQLEELRFDARMHVARAVIIAAECLHEDTLAGSVTFELATRARQGGVPAYAVAGKNALEAFDARVLDLQVILEARSVHGLQAAGKKLAALL